MGPLAWSFCVEMPISQPRPNSPPSVKRVEQFRYTAALSTLRAKASSTAWFRDTTASLWPVEWAAMWAMALAASGTTATASM